MGSRVDAAFCAAPEFHAFGPDGREGGVEAHERAGQDIGLPDEIGDEAAVWPLVDVVGRAELQHAPIFHDGDAVRHGQGFLLVVGHEHEGDAGLALDAFQLRLHAAPELEVERRERFVEQEKFRRRSESPGQGDALLLAARQLIGPPLGHGVEPNEMQHRGDARRHLGAAPALALQPEGHVLLDRQMRKQGIGLEHGVDGPLVRRVVDDMLAVEQDGARIGVLETGQQSQQRGLTAARRAEQGEELVGQDGQRYVIERLDGADPRTERPRDVLDPHELRGGCLVLDRRGGRHRKTERRAGVNDRRFFEGGTGVRLGPPTEPQSLHAPGTSTLPRSAARLTSDSVDNPEGSAKAIL